MVQEAGLPITGALGSVVGTNKAKRKWATAVVSYNPAITELEHSFHPSWNRKLTFSIPDVARPGTLVLAVVDVPDEPPILVISLYGLLRYAAQSVLRAASDLLPIFDDSKLCRRVILAGDLNIHTHSNDRAERARAGPILGVLESFGLRNLVSIAKSKGILNQGPQAQLESCPCGLRDCAHVRTHRHGRHQPGAMANNDYMFATDEITDRLESVTIMNGDIDPAWKYSDHAPMVATFRI